MSYPPPTQYGPAWPPPHRQPKRKPTRAVPIWAVLVIVVLVGAGTGVAGFAVGTHHPDSLLVPAVAPSFTIVSGGKTTKPAGPVTLLTVKGNGIKNTARFTSGSDWTIHYTYNCAGDGGKGNFAVTVYDGNVLGDIPVNALGAKGSDTSQENGDPGSHYLSVNSECSWTLKVTEP